MKKVGGALVMRGRLTGNQTHQLPLFDGSYKTGYRLEEFQIIARQPTVTTEIIGKLHTTPTTFSLSEWDFGRSTEIGWAQWGVPIGSRFAQSDLIDPDAVVIEDLYLSLYGASEGAQINYFIKLQKYDMNIGTASLAMVQARSQGEDAN